MDLIGGIREKVARKEFEFSEHALIKGALRNISREEILEAITAGEVIEDYPQDKYGPSCLILGFTAEGRSLHVQCTYPTRKILKIITVYEPDDAHWTNPRTRRK